MDVRKLIRSASKRNNIPDRECYICGDEHVQNHHILKVEHLAGFLRQHKELTVKDIPIPTEDLCEGHHKMIHVLYGDLNIPTLVEQQEAVKVMELMEIAEASKVFDEAWSDEFNNIIDKTINTVAENLSIYMEEELDYGL